MNTTNHTSPSGEELKPCPFCGNVPYLHRGDGIVGISCGTDSACNKTGLCIAFAPEKEAFAIAAWNSRVTVIDQPIGEDAANGAIGERPIDEEDAFQDWWKTRKGKNTDAYHGWMARAGLTAEKVAAEPDKQPDQSNS
jgi:Lar family restriction alleviation protein